MSTGVRASDPSVAALFDATVSLFHKLKAAAAEIHAQGESTAGKRGVLRGLARAGPQTVPQMARARPVSRQLIQTLVNALEADGLVETVENPAHLRSRLIRLTMRGRKAVKRMEGRERELLSGLELNVPLRDVKSAARVLGAVTRALATASWKT
jgi:DNA-binding MarR family transcriptional regulator